jgi:hypothetical protein
VSTLRELVKRSGRISHSDAEWLNQLTSDWQLIADLVFADLVLWIPTKDDDFIAVAHARPSSAATLFYRDISGQPPQADWVAPISKAFTSGEIVEVRNPAAGDGQLARISAVPVRRKTSS